MITRPQGPAVSPFGPSTQKYWDLRHEYFKRFDEGIQTDAEGLYSVMPENAALAQAQLVKGKTILDGFAGIGGSAIGFARAGLIVVAVDTDRERLEMARNNARIYGVQDRIEFIVGDFFDISPTINSDAVNLDPPWGGPSYKSKATFSLHDFTPDGDVLLRSVLGRFPCVLFRVPRNFDMAEVEDYTPQPSVHPNYAGGRLISNTLVFRRA